mmetsp:Transcript_39327/g.90321  ORF Transcript_39327/g.90321 Transcript_39327/m.90321 type:complete len:224 (-) Transcript_39327:446-1117(-)
MSWGGCIVLLLVAVLAAAELVLRHVKSTHHLTSSEQLRDILLQSSRRHELPPKPPLERSSAVGSAMHRSEQPSSTIQRGGTARGRHPGWNSTRLATTRRRKQVVGMRIDASGQPAPSPSSDQRGSQSRMRHPSRNTSRVASARRRKQAGGATRIFGWRQHFPPPPPPLGHDPSVQKLKQPNSMDHHGSKARIRHPGRNSTRAANTRRRKQAGEPWTRPSDGTA